MGFPESIAAVEPQIVLAIKVAVSLWMIAVAVSDHRSGRIPNWLTAPVIFGVGALRLVQAIGGDWTKLGMLVAWGLVFLLWMLHFIGGGDAKFLMGLYALFPNMEFTAVLALILLVLIVPLVLMELRRRPAGESAGSAYRRVVTGQLLPTEQDLQERGRRYAWTFALPGLVYTWIYWGV
jgi:Flp pilus assembly protein protease CpaA